MVAAARIHGVTDRQEVDPESLVKDIRPWSEQSAAWLSVPGNMATTLLVIGGFCYYYPSLGIFALIVGFVLAVWGLHRKELNPFKLPIQSRLLDPNEMHPVTKAPTPSAGIFFLGNDTVTGKELWLTNSDCRQHFLVLGTTGSGKTELLIAFGANALSWGSGFLFCDGKGDVSLWAKIFILARRWGREDDLLVLNFMTGNADIRQTGGKVKSNTINPFTDGSSDGLTQMVVSLMDEAGGDNAMWQGRAQAMLTGVMRTLTWLRDAGMMDLNVTAIRDYMSLKSIMKLADNRQFPEMPPDVRDSVRAYLTSLPGYVEEKKDKQAQSTLDQHGFLEMQFTRIFGSLAGTYGHIFGTPMAEVDMTDVVLNRRILVIMLPALEKSGPEIANLGKIIAATLKGMMGSTLGSEIEGFYDDVVNKRPTNAPSPFPCILDEVGYYTVDGMALMAAQARSLGFSMVYASQDLPAMRRNNQKEADSIIANTSVKIFGKTEETAYTAKLAVDSAGKATRVRAGGFEKGQGDISSSFMETGSTNYEDINRVNERGLRAQESGEIHVLYKDGLVRARSFYPDPPSVIEWKGLKIQPNHFIMVAKPTAADMDALRKGPEIMAALVDPDLPTRLAAEVSAMQARMKEAAAEGDELAVVALTFEQIIGSRRPVLEAAVGSCAQVFQMVAEATQAFSDTVRTAGRPPGAPVVGYDDMDMAGGGRGGGRLDDRRGEVGRGGFDGSRGRPGDFDDVRRGARGGFNAPPDDIYGIPGERFPQDQDSRPRQQPKAPAMPRGPSRVDGSVPHGTKMDGGQIRKMSDNLTGSDAIMRSLIALDFDADGSATSDDVSRQVDEALGDANDLPEAMDPRVAADKAEAFDRSAAKAGIGEVQAGEAEEADGGGAADGKAGEAAGNDTQPELLTDFLQNLLRDDEGQG